MCMYPKDLGEREQGGGGVASFLDRLEQKGKEAKEGKGSLQVPDSSQSDPPSKDASVAPVTPFPPRHPLQLASCNRRTTHLARRWLCRRRRPPPPLQPMLDSAGLAQLGSAPGLGPLCLGSAQRGRCSPSLGAGIAHRLLGLSDDAIDQEFLQWFLRSSMTANEIFLDCSQNNLET
ncbi:uncharacterized protein LOC144457057 [Phascolarctos cinereus]